ncbi:hypothetical protein EDD21DRAFT_413973 [Dissophora ornata]|nr:hypothetical protein EDD21DRAFT_413973 [Dissophora ornata]
MSTLRNTRIQTHRAARNIKIEDVDRELGQPIDPENENARIIRHRNHGDVSYGYPVQGGHEQLQQVSSSRNERACADHEFNMPTYASSFGLDGLFSELALNLYHQVFHGSSVTLTSNDSTPYTAPSTFLSPAYSTCTIGSTEGFVLQDGQQKFTSYLGDLPPVYNSSSNTLSAVPTGCAWYAPSGALHGSYCGDPNVVAGVAAPFDNARFNPPSTLHVMPDSRFVTTSAVAQERGINAVLCDTQTGPMLSRPSAGQPMDIPALTAETMNTAGLHGSSVNHLHHQSLPPTPHPLPARADSGLQSWSPALKTSPYTPALVPASPSFPPLSTFSPPLRSCQPTPPQTPPHFYFTDPYQPLKPKVDGRKCNSPKILKQLKAQEEEERVRALQLLQKTS